jgi:hypothetical protein
MPTALICYRLFIRVTYLINIRVGGLANTYFVKIRLEKIKTSEAIKI